MKDFTPKSFREAIKDQAIGTSLVRSSASVEASHSNETGHSPLPWKWHVNWMCPGKLKGAYVDAPTARVADVLSLGVSPVGEGSQEICEGNAAYIVKACNAYPHAEKLAEAIKKTIYRFEHRNLIDVYEAREALAAWEGAQQ